MASHNEGDWWMNTLCIHTPIPELCNAIQITGQMPSRFYIIPLHVNLSNNISFNVTLIFHCLLLDMCDGGCSGVLNHVHVQRLHEQPSSQNVVIHEWWHAQLKNWIMNGNQGDHWTFVWTWHHSKQRLIFVTHFINLFNTTMLMPCADVDSETPMSHFWNRWVGMGC